MPSKSAKQTRLMAAAAHNPRFARKVGVPQRVARDFNAADRGMALGGAMPAVQQRGFVQPGGDLGQLAQTDDVLRNASHRLSRLRPFAAGGMTDESGMPGEPADQQEAVEALQAELQSLMQRAQEIVQQLEMLGVPVGDEPETEAITEDSPAG